MHHSNSNWDILQLDTRLQMMNRCACTHAQKNDKMLKKMEHCTGPTGDVQVIEK